MPSLDNFANSNLNQIRHASDSVTTPSPVPNRTPSTGVSRLPMPKPLTEAKAPARIATALSTEKNAALENLMRLVGEPTAVWAG